MTTALFIIFLCVSLIPFLTIVYNFITIERLNETDKAKDQKKLVSILIPARNEENNIEKCLLSCIHQTYKNIEILVLDDNSDDSTPQIVRKVIEEYPDKKVYLYQSKTFPVGWLGKNWACYNLSKHAKGYFFLFIDADVELRENAVNSALYLMNKHSVQMITAFPTQIMKTLGEKIFVDLVVNWSFTALFPFKLSKNLKSGFLTPVIGQFILVEKDVYLRSGGHEAVKDSIVEDRALGVNVKKTGAKILPILGGDQLFCRMYSSLNQAFKGFEKNAFKGSQMNYFTYTIFIIMMPSIFFVPLIFSFVDRIFLFIVGVWFLGLFIKTVIYKQSPLFILIFPIQILSLVPLGISSMLKTRKKVNYWKGRQV